VNYRRFLLQGLAVLSYDEKSSNTPGFRRLRKSANSDYRFRHVCLFVRMELLGLHWTDFHEIFFFFFFYLGLVCLSPGFKHRSLVAYCATLNCHSAQIQYPFVSYKETEVLNCGCAYVFWFSKQLPKNVALTS